MGILPLPHWGVVTRHFLDPVVPNLVKPRVPHMPDDRARFVYHDDGEDAGHAVPLGPEAGDPVDFVVGDRNRLPQTLDNRSGLALEARPEHAHGRVGGFAPCRLTANTIDHHEQPAREVEVKPVFVDLALQSGIGVAGCLQHADRLH